MLFYTSGLYFGNENVAKRRHFREVSTMNNRIIENWNSLITPEDKVYILGGVGEFDFLLSLNGEKVLMFSNDESEFYIKYISSLTTNLEDDFNQEMFEVYVRNIFYIEKVLFNKSTLVKDYTGNVVRLTIDEKAAKSSANFVVAGSIGERQRMFEGGVNSNIFVNGMFPLSEVDVQNLIHSKEKLM